MIEIDGRLIDISKQACSFRGYVEKRQKLLDRIRCILAKHGVRKIGKLLSYLDRVAPIEEEKGNIVPMERGLREALSTLIENSVR